VPDSAIRSSNRHAIARIAGRLARAEGHVRSIRQMVVDHRCADEILIQIAAVKGGAQSDRGVAD
jgi:DNA-binding FrmR family transcriptional regulator